MESSQFINQQRLSKKQLQLHAQQQNQKYFLDSPHDNYQQSRCQYFTSVTTPPSSHFTPQVEYPSATHHHRQNACMYDQQSPTHHRHGHSNVKKFHQSDPNSIEVCIDYENQHNNHVGVVESSIKWNRRNIAATMEKYEPTVKHHHSPNHRGHVTLSHNNHKPSHSDYPNEIHHSDYAYAYYEPGAPMRHQNIPAGFYEEAGPSRPPPPNSIRALLSTARKNSIQRTSGKYSLPSETSSSSMQMGQRSQENVYEEIHDAEKKKMLRSGESIVSLNQSLVEEEFRRVHNRHQRVLGELNLSVEEMLMPPPPTAFIPTSPISDHQTDPMDFLGNGEVTDGSNGAGNYNNNVDLDSGFSGSNSSYIGSLRYQKSTSAGATNANCLTKKAPITELSINHQNTDSGSSFYAGSNTSATDEIGMISLSSRSSSSLFDSGKKPKLKANLMSTQQNAERVVGKFAFWKGKGWKSKLPGFSSTSSVNKVGLGK
ncbi:CLUMA_CG003485, isoform A [Clunio marinus]|uniref:CLUMA_CG003485, isoform A n=1 Tax=Clunio marinus TaxID=568069 RepID=A0A1J1HQM3_9DIPT|nr:CLUMA_CG003485, isoform A [Clunio marinus]